MGDRHTYIINELVKYSLKLDQKGFGANHDGNISVRFDDLLLATPTAVSKGNITADIIITLDMEGNKIAGIGKPFSEIKLHLAAYKARPEITAVVHAHPPFATARGLINSPITPALPEAIISIGALVPVVPFAMPSAKENDALIANGLAEADVLLLPGNGVLAVGTCVENAYLRLELVEHLAKIDYYAHSMGKTPMALAPNDLASLLEKRAAIGLGPKPSQNPQRDAIKQLILEEIKRAIK